jgi:hypothetical protein
LPIVGTLTGEEALTCISDMYKAPPDIVAAARKITGE